MKILAIVYPEYGFVDLCRDNKTEEGDFIVSIQGHIKIIKAYMGEAENKWEIFIEQPGSNELILFVDLIQKGD